LQAEIPRPKSRPAIVRVHEAAVVVESAGKILLRQCQAGERWAGLWDFPRFPIDGLRGKKLESELSQRVAHLAGTLPSLLGTLATIRHTVTHHQITLSCHLATCPAPGPSTQHLHWVTHAQAIDYPLSVTGRKIWRLLGERAQLGPMRPSGLDGKPASGG
jgi:A/G-specific adenine glycosylase